MNTTALPRWRGFNLIEIAETTLGYPDRTFDDFAMDIPEDDFRWIADWGFNFVRVCLNYRLWTKREALVSATEEGLAKVDRIVDLGRKYGIHVSLDMHRGPGKWEVPPREPSLNLWKDQEAVDALAYHWAILAARYKGISSDQLSFDLLNEPERVGGAEGLTLPWFEKWASTTVEAIRDRDPDRLIVIEGPRWARDYVAALDDLGLVWSFHCWDPVSLSHYDSDLGKGLSWPPPAWPMTRPAEGWPRNDDYDQTFDKIGLRKHLQPWFDVAGRGIPVHCGETGGYYKVPHAVFLAWFGDFLDLLQEHNIGFGLFALHGVFGLLNPLRDDIALADWHGHKLDVALLKLLQAH